MGVKSSFFTRKNISFVMKFHWNVFYIGFEIGVSENNLYNLFYCTNLQIALINCIDFSTSCVLIVYWVFRCNLIAVCEYNSISIWIFAMKIFSKKEILKTLNHIASFKSIAIICYLFGKLKIFDINIDFNRNWSISNVKNSRRYSANNIPIHTNPTSLVHFMVQLWFKRADWNWTCSLKANKKNKIGIVTIFRCWALHIQEEFD